MIVSRVDLLYLYTRACCLLNSTQAGHALFFWANLYHMAMLAWMQDRIPVPLCALSITSIADGCNSSAQLLDASLLALASTLTWCAWSILVMVTPA